MNKNNQQPGSADKFGRGDTVRKSKGSQWSGKVVGFYSTDLTPEGYAVESATETGSVQIYPAAALELVERAPVSAVSAVQVARKIESIADELELEASNYEGDFADTVNGCVEALRKLATTVSPPHGAMPEQSADWLKQEIRMTNEKIAEGSAQVARPALTVWYGPMPESNGKSNFTAILRRKDGKGLEGMTNSHCLDQSEYPERVRYTADRVRYLIGEIDECPDILAYDADKHSGYVAPERSDTPAPAYKFPTFADWLASPISGAGDLRQYANLAFDAAREVVGDDGQGDQGDANGAG